MPQLKSVVAWSVTSNSQVWRKDIINYFDNTSLIAGSPVISQGDGTATMYINDGLGNVNWWTFNVKTGQTTLFPFVGSSFKTGQGVDFSLDNDSNLRLTDMILTPLSSGLGSILFGDTWPANTIYIQK